MNSINNFSPNMLKTFEECPKKFFFKYIQKLSLPQKSSLFEKGKKIHALASYYLKGENIEKLEAALNEEEKVIWQKLKNNKYFQLKVINTEYNLSCKIDKYWIGGRLDAFVYDNNQSQTRHAELVSASNRLTMPERSRNEFGMTTGVDNFNIILNNYYILDYKTGNIPSNPEQDFQTIVYLLCAEKLLKQKGGYSSLEFVYLGLKENKEFEIELNDELKKQYEERTTSICDKINFSINSNVFDQNKEKCQTCEYNKLCNIGEY